MENNKTEKMAMELVKLIKRVEELEARLTRTHSEHLNEHHLCNYPEYWYKYFKLLEKDDARN